MQCKISDPLHAPEFKYVPISTGATTLPYGTAPYVPTVQISQTKSDWTVVAQEAYISDAKVIIQCLAKCINQHNFTIFDARDLMPTLNLELPMISHDETICELEFLERHRKGIVVSYQNRYKRKGSPVKLEGPSSKRPHLEATSTSATTRSLLDLLAYRSISIAQAAQQLQVKEKLVEQVVDVLAVVGTVTVVNGLVTAVTTDLTRSVTTPWPSSPKSPILSSSDESYGPIPETPPQFMPMWDPQPTILKKEEDSCTLPPFYSPYPQTSLKCTMSRLPATLSTPPPTQPATCSRAVSSLDVPFSTLNSDKFSTKVMGDLGFDSSLDFLDPTATVDFFHNEFWEQY
jgi:hypothetical protein